MYVCDANLVIATALQQSLEVRVVLELNKKLLVMNRADRVMGCSNMFGRTVVAPTHASKFLWSQNCLLVKLNKTTQNKLVETMHLRIGLNTGFSHTGAKIEL